MLRRYFESLRRGSNFILPERNDVDALAQRGSRNIDEMLVVCEKEDLGLPTKLSQYLEACGGASVVKICKQIVSDEGNRMRAAQIFINRREAEREIKLIRCAV